MMNSPSTTEKANNFSMPEKKKKIDIVVKYFYPVAAGIETNILETYRVLVNKGWDITVHTSDRDYTTGKTLDKEEIIKGIKVIRYPLVKPCFQPKVPYGDTNLICIHNFDILPQFYILLRSCMYKCLGKKHFALVITPHGGFNPEWRVFSKLEAVIKYIYHYTLGTLLINLTADGVRVVSDWEKEEMMKKGVRKDLISVISNGIEDEALENIEEKAGEEIKSKVGLFGKYFIQIGRIYPIKNYETTIRALVDVPKDIKFIIVGPESDKNYLENLKNLILSLGLDNRVIFFGVIRGVDKYYLIKHAVGMVHMAIWESFCNVVHEGMSQGLPIIVANNTALNFLVKDGVNGFLVETKGNKKVAEKINFILDEKNKRIINQISENNVAFAKDSTWSKTAEKMEKLYISLLQKIK